MPSQLKEHLPLTTTVPSESPSTSGVGNLRGAMRQLYDFVPLAATQEFNLGKPLV